MINLFLYIKEKQKHYYDVYDLTFLSKAIRLQAVSELYYLMA